MLQYTYHPKRFI